MLGYFPGLTDLKPDLIHNTDHRISSSWSCFSGEQTIDKLCSICPEWWDEKDHGAGRRISVPSQQLRSILCHH